MRLLGCFLIASSFVASLQAEEIIKDKSPDGKFALRMTHGKEGWDTEIIETATKKKVIDLESVAATGDKDRIVWMSDSSRSVDTYGDEATLVWSRDSQRVAYYDLDRRNRTMSVYFRNGSSFEEVALPEFPKCDEIKNQDLKDVEIVHFGVKPIYWMDSGALSVSVEHWWRTPEGKLRTCEPTVTITFDAQRHALLAKAEEPPEGIGTKIESPNGTFFVEELNTPAKDEPPRMNHEVWIVSAKDPAARERLPDFYEEEGIDIVNGAAISPDENWILITQHHASSWISTYLLHRKEGLKFEYVPKSDSKERFDDAAWKFFSKIEGVPFKKIDANDEGPTRVSVLDWSDDSGRLLLDLHGGLTGKDHLAYGDEDYKKPGVSLWLAYYNTKTQKFELTDKLRKWNKGARKRWMASDAQSAGVLPPSAESIGREGADAPVAERLKKYQIELAAMVERREEQLDGADRAEFEKKESEWHDKLEDDAAKIKDARTRLGMQARSTWYHLIDVRDDSDYWLPVYEEAKSRDTKQSQP